MQLALVYPLAHRPPQTTSVGGSPSALGRGCLTCKRGRDISWRGGFPALRLELVSRLMKAWSPGLRGYLARRQHCFSVHVRTCIVHCRETLPSFPESCAFTICGQCFSQIPSSKKQVLISHPPTKREVTSCVTVLAVLISVHAKHRIMRRVHGGPLPPAQ